MIEDVRRQSEGLPHYLEVRYEDLVSDAESTLRGIGAFIELPWNDYRNGRRRAFLCARQTDLSQLPAKVEQSPPASPVRSAPAGNKRAGRDTG